MSEPTPISDAELDRLRELAYKPMTFTPSFNSTVLRLIARLDAAEAERDVLKLALTDLIETAAEALNAEEGMRVAEPTGDAEDQFSAAMVHLDRDWAAYRDLTEPGPS